MPASPELRAFARAVSRIMGWTYFLAWSLSFYPQALLNYQRRSTAGLTPDYPMANVVGYIAYSISTASFLFSPLIREQYAVRHKPTTATGAGDPHPHPRAKEIEPTVRLNDFVFAFHALIICLITYSQFYPRLWRFERVSEKWQKPSRVTLGLIFIGLCGVAAVFGLAVHGGHPYDASNGWAWIDVVYAVGYIKLLVTVIKYIPQAWSNYRRKSTVGWSMGQNWLDFTGSILSISQLLVDCSLQPDWSGLTGNPVKLGLGNVSLFFDIIFIIQHYGLYRSNNKRILQSEQEEHGRQHERDSHTTDQQQNETTPLLHETAHNKRSNGK